MKKVLFVVLAVAGVIGLLELLGYDVTIGGYVLGREGLEKEHQRGYRKSRIVVGGCVIGLDVDARMLTEVVPSLIIIGGMVCPRAVFEAYGSNLKVLGGLTFRDGSTSPVDA